MPGGVTDELYLGPVNSVRRRLLGAVLVVSTALAGHAAMVPAGAASAARSDEAVRGADQAPALRILSSPDFLNADVGDVSRLPRWDEVHNSTNASYERSLDVVLDQFAAERPDQVLVAGDLVEGHWGQDANRTGIFGPVDTHRHRVRAAKRAGNLYYRQWKRRFVDHGLPVPHIAVGDHEIGDNPWPRGAFKARAVAARKRNLARHLIGKRYPVRQRPVGTPFAKTSYWQPLSDDVLLVSVDIFRPQKRGKQAISASMAGAHLRWFKRALVYGRSNYDWVVVQAHTPALGPVRLSGSSGLQVKRGRRSAFWRAMVKHDTDLYLAGEVHKVTAIDPERGPVQVSHGGLFPFGGTNYLLLDVYEDRLELASYGFTGRTDRSRRLWQVSRKRATPWRVNYQPGRVWLGSAELGKDHVLRERQGTLAPAAELGNTH